MEGVSHTRSRRMMKIVHTEVMYKIVHTEVMYLQM